MKVPHEHRICATGKAPAARCAQPRFALSLLRSLLLLLTLSAVYYLLPASANSQTELGSEDDLTVLGINGTALDPDTEIKGFTVFGSTQAAYTGAAAGPGNVVVNGALAVSSGAYFADSSTFPAAGRIFLGDGSTGQILSKKSDGALQWASSSVMGDNLGNHIATTTLNMATFNIVNVGSITANAAITTYSTMTVAGNAFSVGGSGFAVASGKVGIGTISPQEKLTLYGDGSLILFNSANTNPLSLMGLAFGENAGAPPYSMAFSYDGSATGTNNRLVIRDESNNLDRVTFQLGGNVGIGETSPLTALHVVRSADTLAPLRIQNSLNTGYSGVHFADNGGTIVGHMGYANPSAPNFPDQFYFGSIAAKKMNLTTADTTRMTIDAVGNVGISSTAPSYRLVVSSGAGEAGNMVVISTGGSNVIRMTGAGEIYANNFIGNISGAWGLSGADNLGNHIATTTLNMANKPIVSVSSMNLTASNLAGAAAVFQVAGSTFVINYNGKVGIGTISPQGNLDVAGGRAIISKGVTGYGILTERYSDVYGLAVQIDPYWNYGAAYMATGNSSDAFWQEYSKTRSADGSTHGILQADDGIGVLNFNGDDGTQLSSGATLKVTVDGPPGAGSMPAKFGFFTSPAGSVTPIERLTIRNNGNIGISTGMPQARLDVLAAGSLGTDFAQIWRNSGGAIVSSMSATGVLYPSVSASDNTKVLKAGDTMTGQLTLAGSSLTVTSALGISASGNITAARYQVDGSTVLAVLPGTGSLGVGSEAGRLNTANYNTFIGNMAGNNNTTGYSNTFMGYQAGLSNTGGTANAFFGVTAGQANTVANSNTFTGFSAGYANTTGAENTISGARAGYYTQSGSANVLFGNYAGGYGAGSANSFSSSTVVGYKAGYGLTTGSDNIFLGWQAGYNVTSGTGNIVIGYNRNTSAPIANNELNIGDLIFGNLSSNTVGISTRVPQAALDVVSTGTASNIYAQIWRDGTGAIVSSMTSTGRLTAASVQVVSSAAGSYTAYISTSSAAGSYSVAVSSLGITNINNLVIENRAADPAAPVTGQIWLRTN